MRVDEMSIGVEKGVWEKYTTDTRASNRSWS